MEDRCAGSQVEYQSLDGGFLALSGRVAIQGDISLDRDELHSRIRIGVHHVNASIGIGKQELDRAFLIVDGVVDLTSRIDGIDAVQDGTGESRHAAAFAGLAEQQGETIFAGGIQAVDRRGSRGDLVGAEGDLLAFTVTDDRLDLHAGQVFLVGSLIPGQRHGRTRALLDHGIEGSADSRRGESLLQISPIGGSDSAVDAADTGIIGFVHLQSIDRVGILIGSQDIGLADFGTVALRSDFLGTVGLFIDFKFITFRIDHLLPGEDDIRTGGRDHLGFELQGCQDPVIVDLFDQRIQGPAGDKGRADTQK